MARALLLTCLLVLASLASGCISGGTPASAGTPDGAAPQQDPQEGSPSAGGDAQADDGTADDGAAADAGTPETAAPPEGSQAGSPATHGDPLRDDGTADTAPEGAQFVARRTVTIDNDFGGAGRSDILLTGFNGGISVTPSADGGYHLVAELFGRGATPDDARQALDLLTLNATDDLGQGTLRLSFVLTSGTPAPVPLPIGLSNGINNGASLHLSVPAQPSHDLEARNSNGAIAVQGLHGPRLTMAGSNGALSVDGAFGEADLETSNAAIGLKGTFHDVVAGTSNGAVSADLQPTRSGAVRLTTSNAAVAVELPRDASAFDITGDTTNGEVRFDLEGRESEDDAHGEFRSNDWASAGVRVTIDLATSNAMIHVGD